MKKILVLVTAFLISIGSYAQADSSKITGADLGVVSKKATQGKYAILYIYRPNSKKISLASFTINVNDSAVCKVKKMNVIQSRFIRLG